jgi:hypothetical protein
VGCLEARTRLAHLIVCPLAACGGHRPCRIRNYNRVEPFSSRVENRGANTDVLGQTADPYTLHASFPQLGCEAGLVEGRILIAIEPNTLCHHNRGVRELQLVVKPSAVSVLKAVHRPLAAGLPEAEMVERMPITGRNHGDLRVSRCFDPTVQYRNDFITTLNRERAARTEVYLNVNDDQRVTRPKYVSRI